MQTINVTIADLQTHIVNLDASIEISSARLLEPIINTKDILQKSIEIYKATKNSLLIDFATANIILLEEMTKINKEIDLENTSLEHARTIMLHITAAYQEVIVPMLTKIHNLSADEETTKITAITSLGNEVITYSSQINQFASKFTSVEKIFTMLGVILMLNSICMMIIILTKAPRELTMLTCLTIMAIGCCLYHKAMLSHKEDPSTDIITTSVKKMEPLIYEIAKNYHENPSLLKEIIYADTKSKTHSPETAQQEIPMTSHSLLDKVKNVLDIFNKK